MEKIPEATTAPQPVPEPLNYHQPRRSGRITAWARRLPRPSYLTIALLFLTLTTPLWLYKDHAPWIVTRQFEGTLASNAASAAISPDGKQFVAIAGDQQNLRMYDIDTGNAVRDLRLPSGTIKTALFSPDGSRIWTVNTDKEAVLWDAATGRALATLSTHWRSGSYHRAASQSPFSPDGRRLAVSDESTLRICDGHTGTVLLEIATDRPFIAPLFSPDSQYLAAVYPPWDVWVWETKTWQRIAMLAVPLAGNFIGDRHLAFAPDSKRLIFARDPNIEMWDARFNTLSTPFTPGPHLNGCYLSPDGRYLVTHSGRRPQQLWDMTTSKVVGDLTPFGEDTRISPDGQLVAGGLGVGKFPSLELLATFSHEGRTHEGRIAWLPNSRSLLAQSWGSSTSLNNQIHLFQRRRPEALYGLLWLPQSWLTLLATLALAWSIHRDLRRWRLHPPPL